jgi:hypothetical protein
MNKLQSFGGRSPVASNWNDRGRDIYLRQGNPSISIKEIAMLKVAVVAFALFISGFMIWVGHEDSNFARLPHATLVKRAA